jgi:hypothetical protein
MQRKLLASDLSQSPNPVYSAKPKNPALGVLSRRRATGAAVRSMDRSTIQTLQLLAGDAAVDALLGSPSAVQTACHVRPEEAADTLQCATKDAKATTVVTRTSEQVTMLRTNIVAVIEQMEVGAAARGDRYRSLPIIPVRESGLATPVECSQRSRGASIFSKNTRSSKLSLGLRLRSSVRQKNHCGHRSMERG